MHAQPHVHPFRLQVDELHTIVNRLSRVSELVQCGARAMNRGMTSMGVDDATHSYIMQQVGSIRRG